MKWDERFLTARNVRSGDTIETTIGVRDGSELVDLGGYRELRTIHVSPKGGNEEGWRSEIRSHLDESRVILSGSHPVGMLKLIAWPGIVELSTDASPERWPDTAEFLASMGFKPYEQDTYGNTEGANQKAAEAIVSATVNQVLAERRAVVVRYDTENLPGTTSTYVISSNHGGVGIVEDVSLDQRLAVAQAVADDKGKGDLSKRYQAFRRGGSDDPT